MKKINTVEVLVVMDDNETYCPIDGCMYIAVTKEELEELKSGATKVKELMDYEGRKVPFIPPELKESVPSEVKELLSKG